MSSCMLDHPRKVRFYFGRLNSMVINSTLPQSEKARLTRLMNRCLPPRTPIAFRTKVYDHVISKLQEDKARRKLKMRLRAQVKQLIIDKD